MVGARKAGGGAVLGVVRCPGSETVWIQILPTFLHPVTHGQVTQTFYASLFMQVGIIRAPTSECQVQRRSLKKCT